PLGDPGLLPRRVLCVAPNPEDAVLGCGALLAFHAARGDAITAFVLTGDAGAARRACESLGVLDVRALELPARHLGAQTDLVARSKAILSETEPLLVY